MTCCVTTLPGGKLQHGFSKDKERFSQNFKKVSSPDEISKESTDEEGAKPIVEDVGPMNHEDFFEKIDEIEKEPAYKRHGVDLEETKHSSEEERSRLTLDIDENEDIQLRKNNKGKSNQKRKAIA